MWKCQSKFTPLMFISCLSVQPCERGWVCVLMMCECACKYQRKKKEMKHIQSPSILSTLLQESSIFLNLTATNLWLHYYSQCFILIPTHRPGGGLVNGEGDGEGDWPVPLLWYAAGLALGWIWWEYKLPFALILVLWFFDLLLAWCLYRVLTCHVLYTSLSY